MNRVNRNYTLMASSCLFVFPIVYGLKKGKRLLSAASLLSMAFSLNYWRHPIPGTRREMDIFVAKLVGVLFYSTGFFKMKGTGYRLLASMNGILLISSYLLSCELHSKGQHQWLYAHVVMHFSTSVGKLLVISFC